MFAWLKPKPKSTALVVAEPEIVPLIDLNPPKSQEVLPPHGLAVGQIWSWQERDPFREPNVVLIQDIKGDYVKYQYKLGDKFAGRGSSDDIVSFKSIYKKRLS